MKKWHYKTASDLDQPLVERLKRFPREPDMTVYVLRSAVALAIRAFLKVYHRFRISGKENLPTGGSFIMVANHSSHLDALCLLSALPLRKLHRAFPAAAKDYFFENVPRLAIAAVIVNALPFDRESKIRNSLRMCRELLSNPGNVLVIFPEGTRSTTGEIGEFKPGIGMLVDHAKVPVVPCYIDGALKAWPKGCSLPRPRRIRLIIGAPRSYGEARHGRETALEIAQDLRQAVVELAGARLAGSPAKPKVTV